MKKSNVLKIILSADRGLFGFRKCLSSKIASKLIGVFCIMNLVLLRSDIYELYGQNGLIGSNVPDPYLPSYSPKLSWLTNILGHWGIPEYTAVLVIISAQVLCLSMITFEYKKFLFSVIAWFLQLCTISSSFIFATGGDSLITFLLFINMFICADDIIKNRDTYLSLYSFTIRFLQIQLCIIYFFSGFGKILGFDWFDGNAVWLISNTYAPVITKHLLHLVNYHILAFQLSGWIVITIELFYPLLVIFQPTRLVVLILVISMHLFISIIMGLTTFGGVMILFNLIAWGGYFKNSAAIPVKWLTAHSKHRTFSRF